MNNCISKIFLVLLLICIVLTSSSCEMTPIVEESQNISALESSLDDISVSGDISADNNFSNFTIELDISLVEYPEKAPIIYAEKLIWEFDELRAVFGVDSIPGLTITDDCVREGSADILRAEKDAYSLALINFLDGKYEDKIRHPVGSVQFSYDHSSDLDCVVNCFINRTDYFDTYSNTQVIEYRSEHDLNLLVYTDTVNGFTDVFRSLGLKDETLPQVDISYCLSPEDQINFLENGPELLVPYYVDPESGYRDIPEELKSIENEFLDAIVLGWRQNFCGIPVNGVPWGNRFSTGSLDKRTAVVCQKISSYLMVDGGCYFGADNLFVPIEYGEEKQICSPEIPVEHLSETMSVVLDDIQYYLVRVELCYAIFEDGDNYVLYPYWLLFVESKQNCSGEIIRSASTYDIYTYDGYTGEMIVSVENPLK